MTEQNTLHDALLALKKELAGIEPESDKQKRLITDLQGDIDDYLDDSTESSDTGGITEKVEVGIEQFEVTHPQLSLYFNDALQMLSSLGI